MPVSQMQGTGNGVFMEVKVHQLECTKCSLELRSGRVIKADEGFTRMLGYTKEDIAKGITYNELFPCFDPKKIVTELREKFVFSSSVCYEHTVMCKDGTVKAICSMIEIQNTLLQGHRVLAITATELDSMVQLDTDLSVAE